MDLANRITHVEYVDLNPGSVEILMLSDEEASKENEALNQYSESGFDSDESPVESGYFWWACFPGCIPDSDLFGPFDTIEEAIADARGN